MGLGRSICFLIGITVAFVVFLYLPIYDFINELSAAQSFIEKERDKTYDKVIVVTKVGREAIFGLRSDILDMVSEYKLDEFVKSITLVDEDGSVAFLIDKESADDVDEVLLQLNAFGDVKIKDSVGDESDDVISYLIAYKAKRNFLFSLPILSMVKVMVTTMLSVIWLFICFPALQDVKEELFGY